MKDPAELEREYVAEPARPRPKPEPAEKKVLVRNPREMAAENEAAAEGEKLDREDGRLQKIWTFQFAYEDPTTNRSYEALVTNEILSLDKRLKAASLESQLIGGVPFNSVDPVMGNVAKAIAHMTMSVQKVAGESPAGWTDNFLALLDTQPVLHLFEEVLGHENTFRGVGQDSKGRA